ncbi:MAG TPA: MerR family transcriptional regulator [Candidatus Syntrophosphaera sp.]|jgi:DNA-binding transcriptional MerR regulator|nr:MerR family transcriptional regulator [Candidatus Syntrophosphaera sp.]OQB07423.1 MAG: HTH-type transcriptional repressor YcgE [Candidatus Cloacimonetes bacterium ADurb.Bin211]HOD60298.1 MerR family transcriptional regulator [Candidatus Syntrophosphaera sp.]HQM79646.1 MerR family transcriptional regulator [Candidatus Syntrophosphaera sp.]
MKKYYYTIGEVSNLLGVKPYVIRYWESEFSFLKPRKESGRIRKYSEENVELLRKIQDLLYNQRYTIEGARQKLKQELRNKSSQKPILIPPKNIEISAELQENLSDLRKNLEELCNLCHQLRSKKI